MQDTQNKQSLFSWQKVPDSPVRPQKFVDFDFADYKSKVTSKTHDYNSQLVQKMQAAATRKRKAADSLPQEESPAT